jgi:hypothetical protein
VNTRLQEYGIDDDNQACGARAQDCGRIDRPLRGAAPQAAPNGCESARRDAPAGAGASSAPGSPLTHFASPSRSRSST